ncbi:hypothetical protein LSH36_281g00045 [Paralvinella palmiformis]|uniref:Uncharacterized protein n=1 Tax=Paralvinella palmiformis TaxID=53620 RepID=A0AAD9N1P9_9ANNE|nr:hypothetical protein LSH36_281g00045 [Paralvinella palmiformis]
MVANLIYQGLQRERSNWTQKMLKELVALLRLAYMLRESLVLLNKST